MSTRRSTAFGRSPGRPLVDRGAHESGRHARARRDPWGVAPVRVATGEHAANRVIFKQLLQAAAISFCQLDGCRLGGINEELAVLLLAATSACRCARTPAASGCASTCSTSRCSTTSRSPDDGRSGHGVRRSPARALPRPRGHSQRAATWRRYRPPVTAAKCSRRRRRSFSSPTVRDGPRRHHALEREPIDLTSAVCSPLAGLTRGSSPPGRAADESVVLSQPP